LGDQAQLVALYCSKLSSNHLQAEIFADFLNGMLDEAISRYNHPVTNGNILVGFDGDRSERALLVEVGEHHQLDMKQILRNLYHESAISFMQKVCFVKS
jgi:hypothetical protein